LSTREIVIGHATVHPFEMVWTDRSTQATRHLMVGGVCSVVHVAIDGAYLVRTMGGYRLYVNPEQVLRYQEL
jgi:Lon protease-like protein